MDSDEGYPTDEGAATTSPADRQESALHTIGLDFADFAGEEGPDEDGGEEGEAPERPGRLHGAPALRAYLESLSAPFRPDIAQARGALWVLNLLRTDVDPEDPRLRRILAPVVRLTPETIMEVAGGGRPAARRLAQQMRDEGLLIFEGRGVYVVEPAPIEWPETDRSQGWVYPTRGGKIYGL